MRLAAPLLLLASLSSALPNHACIIDMTAKGISIGGQCTLKPGVIGMVYQCVAETAGHPPLGEITWDSSDLYKGRADPNNFFREKNAIGLSVDPSRVEGYFAVNFRCASGGSPPFTFVSDYYFVPVAQARAENFGEFVFRPRLGCDRPVFSWFTVPYGVQCTGRKSYEVVSQDSSS